MWNFFRGTPKHKIYQQYAEKSREELIDALLVAEELHNTDMVAVNEAKQLTEDRVEKVKKQAREEAENLAREVKQREEDTARAHTQEMEDLKREHDAAFEIQAKENQIALSDAELKYTYDESKKVTEAKDARIAAEKALAVAEAENTMLKEMINLNGDIVDIKDMTNKIIDKLPTINLSSLPSAPAAKQDKKGDN